MPLPIFERDADETFRGHSAPVASQGPDTLVVRYGRMAAIAELPYSGTTRPGCGSKLVVTTPRGTEMAELLTVACGNGGCGKNLKRSELLEYVAQSGAESYPFTTGGRVDRLATAEDLQHWTQVQDKGRAMLRPVREAILPLGLPIKVIEVELLFGGEVATIYTTVVLPMGASPTPGEGTGIDLAPVTRAVAHLFPSTIVQVLSVGPRDEARLVADYEKCGQHCCCQNFLKVLKPVSMKHARHQKPTMDPLKISGRCGRLMCCLRYEEQTYVELAAKLPKRGMRVGTPEGPGEVRDGKVLVQLVLVRLESSGKEIAVPVEELSEPTDVAAGATSATPDANAAPSTRQPRRRRPRNQ